MSDFVRVAIVGTGQVGDSSADVTGTPADALVERLDATERERAFLLRAGAAAVVRRAARPLARTEVPAEPAAADMEKPAPPRLAAHLSTLLQGNEVELLPETLEKLTRAGMRLPHALLPLALSKSGHALHAQLRPVLGERGRWLARTRKEWSWALELGTEQATLPADAEARFAEGSAAERRALLALARRTAPELARRLIAESWKQEKAEQRLAWLEVMAADLAPADEGWLQSVLADRSAQVRLAAAHLLWRLSDSELARRMRARVDALCAFEPARPGVLSKLKGLVSGGAAPAGTLRVDLPPEGGDPEREREGIAENAPQGVGRRQFWLTQMLGAIDPDHLCRRFGLSADQIVTLALQHEHAASLLDGLTRGALRHDARGWYAPLWDAAAGSQLPAVVSEQQFAELTRRLSPDEAEPRMLALLQAGRAQLLALRPAPWPPQLCQALLQQFARGQSAFSELLPLAALAIPVELLPERIALPELAPGQEPDYALRAHMRALDRYHSLAALRLSIAREIGSS